ncbi:MAG: hypoxanthine phosphoribosyltransferase [Leptospirales bacterium]|nr:hypoxanthine phosphoribosyltransferase [Leptospirales bacterium]
MSEPASIPDLPVLISSAAVAARINEMAQTIAADYAGKALTLVGILKGAFVFLADLSRRLPLPLWIDFIEVSSYGAAASSSGAVKLVRDLSHDPAGRHILLVEDIVDTGLTMHYLYDMFRARGALSVEAAALLVRSGKRSGLPGLRYTGFELDTEAFVAGYGMDYSGLFRNIPDVVRLDEPSRFDSLR